jgi:hypothetical protein
VLYCCAISTTLYCGFAQKYVLQAYVYKDVGNENKNAQAVKASAAGAVVVLVTNFVFALLFSREGPYTAASDAVRDTNSAGQPAIAIAA